MTGANTFREEREVSLCSLRVGEWVFGIDTREITEVLGRRAVQRVPLAPACIRGLVPYRGEVLTAVSCRSVLRMEENTEDGCVLVLEEGGERFGLIVDAVEGVLTVRADSLEPNPCTLDRRCAALFDGAYPMEGGGLTIRLDPKRLQPSRLEGCGGFDEKFETEGAK